MPNRESGEVWPAIRTGCVDLLKTYGRKEEASLVAVGRRSLFHAFLQFVHGNSDLASLCVPNSPNWCVEEYIFPIGRVLYVPGFVKDKEGNGYPARIHTVTTGKRSVEEATFIRFLIAGFSEHIALGRDCAHISIGSIQRDFKQDMLGFKARMVNDKDELYWQEKFKSFQITEAVSEILALHA